MRRNDVESSEILFGLPVGKAQMDHRTVNMYLPPHTQRENTGTIIGNSFAMLQYDLFHDLKASNKLFLV